MKNIIRNLNKKQLLLLVFNIVFIVAYIVVNTVARNSVESLFSQQEARRWESEKNAYAQVSAFYSHQREMQEIDISNIRSEVQLKLSQDALNESKENARVWIDAYSGECITEVRKDNNILSATAVGVGGEFFQFHPSKLLSGGYISDEDTNHDRVVIDQGLAWAMFGSNDVVGMQLWMGNSIYTIAGVIQVEDDELTKAAYGDNNRIYMFYDELRKHQEELTIACYEAVIPNPISNYALNTLKEACGIELQAEQRNQKDASILNFESIEVIENSNRYDTMNLLNQMKHMKLRIMQTNGIAYPYWENVARVVEEQQVVLLVARMLILLLPCISLLYWFCSMWKKRSWTTKDIVIWIIDQIKGKLNREETTDKEDDCMDEVILEDDAKNIMNKAEYVDEQIEEIIEEEFILVTDENIFDIK